MIVQPDWNSEKVGSEFEVLIAEIDWNLEKSIVGVDLNSKFEVLMVELDWNSEKSTAGVDWESEKWIVAEFAQNSVAIVPKPVVGDIVAGEYIVVENTGVFVSEVNIC